MLITSRSQEVEAPWTASRCNRTLRQLTAFLAKVEKGHKYLSHKSCSQIVDIDEPPDHGMGRGTNPDEAKTDDPSWVCGQDRKSRRRAEKSYAGKRKLRRGLSSSQQARCLPYTPKVPKTAEVIIDTPMMASVLTPPHINSSELSYDVQVSESQLQPPPKPKVPLLRRSRGEKATKETDTPSILRWSSLTIDEMKQIVTSFLAATSPTRVRCDGSNDDLSHRKGSKSLFSACLCTVPTLIITEQSHHDVISDGYDGEVQVASTLLADLEDHYGDTQKGWGPLRVVTRAYGIALICNSIRKCVLPLEAAMILSSSLNHAFGFNDATIAIAEAIVEVRQIAREEDLDEILTFGNDITESNRHMGLFPGTATSYAAALSFRLTNMAFRRSSGTVTLGLISTRPTYLKNAIKSCSRGKPSDTLSLVKTLLLSFLDLNPRSAEASTAQLRKLCHHSIGDLEEIAVELDNSLDSQDVPASLAAITSFATNVAARRFRSGIVALTAFPISRKMRQRESNAEQLPNRLAQCASVSILRDICLAIQVDMEIHGVTHLTKEQVQRRAWIFFAYSLLAKLLPLPNAIRFLTPSLATLVLNFESRNGLVADLSSLVLEIVTACDLSYRREERVHSLSVLKEITDSLCLPTPCHSPLVALLFSSISVEASMAYTQMGRKDSTDALQWVMELQHQVQASLSREDITPLTPSLQSFSRGFRWDECISEWVAKTPSAAEMYTVRMRLDHRDYQASRLSLQPVRGLPKPPGSSPDSPVDEPMSKRMKKRKSAPDQTELHWDGDFAFRRLPKKRKRLEGDFTLPNSSKKLLADLGSGDELGGSC
jgi:hypothetical protein